MEIRSRKHKHEEQPAEQGHQTRPAGRGAGSNPANHTGQGNANQLGPGFGGHGYNGGFLHPESPSQPQSGLSSAMSSRPGSSVDLNGLATEERPTQKRGRSLFSRQHQRPRYGRARSSLLHAGQSHQDEAQIAVQENAPYNAITRLAQRTQNNVRMWYLRSRKATSSRRRTELDKLREMQRSELLFGQAFAISPMVLLAASSLQPEDAQEKKVPVVLQQLSIRATQEQAKHYHNMVRIHLEYGAGLGLIQWEIVRGYRDFLYLRAKLKSQIKRTRTKKLKLPKLPRPKAFGLKEYKNKQNIFYPDSDGEVDSDLEMSSDEEEDEALSHDGETEEDLNSVSSRPDEPIHELNRSPEQPHHRSDNFLSPRVSGNNTHYNTATTTPMLSPKAPRSLAESAMAPATHDQFNSYSRAIEEWLNRIKDIYALRSDSNHLMQFLELSHLSLKLSAEYSFHGKEGTLIIRSLAKDMGWKVNHYRPRDLKDMVERHTKKWVLVKDSFVAIVDNIYSTRIREVFLADSSFSIKHIEENFEDEQGQDDRKLGEQRQIGAVNPVTNEVSFPALPDAPHVYKGKGAKSVFLHLQNNERELKLAAMNPRDLRRWQASILQMKASTPWVQKHRFGSFAPVRKNVFGQWFVDGRDYMWVLSEALENAKDTVFILDWWLSPELYLRRPPEGNQKWRLDRVLKRKAEQGVKIFVIVYRNVGPTIPIDSLWTKHSLMDLHENIHVMRSPHQLANKSSLFWAHHEKLCVIDNAVAFNGGIDLCFGRWDTWQHTLTDDAPEPFLSAVPTPQEWAEKRTQLFPGKDYSNARVKDFYELNKPFDDMYDRANVPRMPWHDIHQMVLGQPARDFARHFVQRWNYVVRQKIPSRPTPLLLPPSDFSQEDLDRLHMTGTCEYQVLRSSGEWSLGLKQHEQSIQNAYLKLIEESEHLVYIENQFFVTSTEVDGVMIENQIGNALVQRIVRAHENNEKWRAFILIPLMPGFEAEVDTDKASSVRVICQCQFNSISRGPHSIFYRLESMGIRPDQYISFFSLRKWGKFSDTPDSPNGGRICTELLYIHAKCMIVDDRVAIIGSANINERSMRGLRDSEVAVCVRDTKVVESRMAGKPWKAGKFAHSLRVRLMREHLGVDIDKLDIIERCLDALKTAVELRVKQGEKPHSHNSADGSAGLHKGQRGQDGVVGEETSHFPEWLYPELHSFNWYGGTSLNRGIRDYKKYSSDSRIQKNSEHKADVMGDGVNTDHYKERENSQKDRLLYRQNQAAAEDLDMENEAKKLMNQLLREPTICSTDQFKREFYTRFTKIDIMRPLKRAADLPMPHTDEDGLRAVNNESIPIDPWQFDDPLDDRFVNDRWMAVAERNTLIFRLVFRCQPDDEVETWKDYKQYQGHLERFYEKQKEDGGPASLRKKGHHEPDRVDKYVLGGSIKRPDPEVLRQNIMRATNADYYRSQMESQSNNTPQKTLVQHTPREKVRSHPEVHRYAESLKASVHSKLSSVDHGLMAKLDQLHLKTNDESKRRSSHPGEDEYAPDPESVLDEGTEFGQPVDSDYTRETSGKGGDSTGSPHEKRHRHSRHMHHDTQVPNGHAVDQTNDRNVDGDINGYANNTGSPKQTEGYVDAPSSVPEAASAGADDLISFPTLNSGAKQSQPLKPSVSAGSTRRHAHTINGTAKPARRWGHFEHVLDAQVAEDMLQGVTGHLVIFPTEWLNRELDSGNWNFQLDRIAPLEIYD